MTSEYGMKLLALSVACVLAGSAAGAPQPAPEPPPAQDKHESPTPKPLAPAPGAKKPPTLDALLGLSRDQGAPGDGGSDELDRKLKEEDPGDLFTQAIELMETSARRLEAAGDTGIETQRTQEDTLRKLDQLISSLERRQQQQQQQQKNQNNQDSQRDQQQAQQQQQDRRQASNSTDSSPTDLPARRDGTLRPGLEAAKAAWGALPKRIRDMLLQGSGEKFSTTYERQTEEYYRKLAEQK